MGFRTNFTIQNNHYYVEILALKPQLSIAVNGKPYTVSHICENKQGSQIIEINGLSFTATCLDSPKNAHVKINTKSCLLKKQNIGVDGRKETQSGNIVLASMPGILVETYCEEGDLVSKGDIILATESMKMQTNVTAPKDGVIKIIHFQKNETFEKGATLVSLKEVPID